MWFRNLVFISLCFAGLGGLSSQLLDRRHTVSRHASEKHLPKDFLTVVDRANSEFAESLRQKQVQAAARADDFAIARRLSLGLTGTIPSLEELRVLEGLPSEERIDWWVDHLLNDRRSADYLAERMARALVGTENGPFIVYRRRRFVSWLSDGIYANRPYDQLVRELISGSGVWTSSPAVNFVSVTVKQDDTDQPDPIRLAGRTTRAFLGMRIDCLQCHDDNLGNIELGTPRNPRGGTQEDFHQLAAFFSEAHISLLGIGDAPDDYRYQFLHEEQERLVPPTPPFLRELTPANGSRREQLAAWITHPQNVAFARATVNRIWAWMCGRPLVEPVDDMPLNGPFPPALETLAADFIAHHFNLHRLIRVIAATNVYQRDSRAAFEVTPRHEQLWAVFPLSRLRPEQVAGALIQAASLPTINAQSHIIARLSRYGDEKEFVQRYGDAGEDELDDRGGTITQRLLMMNGDLVKGRTEPNPIMNAATKIAILSPDDETAIKTAYLAVLTRNPKPQELSHFAARLQGLRGDQRNECLEDLYWVLTNSTEFCWNH